MVGTSNPRLGGSSTHLADVQPFSLSVTVRMRTEDWMSSLRLCALPFGTVLRVLDAYYYLRQKRRRQPLYVPCPSRIYLWELMFMLSAIIQFFLTYWRVASTCQ